MGSWCAASKHPWRHAQKFRGILQPRHLARARCSMAATRKLPAAHCDLSNESLLQGRGMPRQLRACLCATHLHPSLGIPSSSRSTSQQHRAGSCNRKPKLKGGGHLGERLLFRDILLGFL